MALLHFLLSHRDELALGPLAALHFNHGLRGEESDADENFVHDWCEHNGVVFRSERGAMSEREKPKGESVESWARRLRYDFLEQEASRNGAVIAVAHNRDDVAETVLFNLMRGTGLRGARGIPPVRGSIVRPFVDVSRQSIEEYCAQNSIPYVTDRSNLGDDYARNRIRHNIVPEMKAINSAAVEHLSRFAAHAAQISDELERRAGVLVEQSTVGQGRYRAAQLLSDGEVIARFALKLLCEAHGCDADERHVSLARRVVGGDLLQIQLVKTLYLRRDGDDILFRTVRENIPVPPPVSLCAEKNSFGGAVVTAHFFVGLPKKQDCEQKKYKSILNNTLDCDKIVGCLVIRGRREGDTFCSARRKNTKTIKKLLHEMGVPAQERSRFPLVCDDEGVVWVPGQGIAARVAADDDSIHLLELSFEEEKISCTTTS